MTRPQVRHLDTSVIRRLQKQNAEKKTEDRIYWRLANWSEPSDAVLISRNESILVGEVIAPPPIRVKLGDDTIVSYEKVTSEPQVKAIIVGFDEEQNGDIPSETISLRRGSVANFTSKKKIEMIDPQMMMLKEVGPHKFRSDIMVVDILGGQPLSGRDGKDRLKIPGELLVLTPDGQLQVREEISDSRKLYYNTFPEADLSRFGAYGASEEDEDDSKRQRRRRRSRGGGGYGGY